MLVCVLFNVVMDEFLLRVLDWGFIDGEMKYYKLDVVCVGVDIVLCVV